MPTSGTPKLEIAIEMLERGIELYLRGDSYHSALHLAGAAEELLNVYARSMVLPDGARLAPSLDQLKAALVAGLTPKTDQEILRAEKWAHDRLTDPRNSVKHMRGTGDTHYIYDSEQEAKDLIDRTVTTYLQVNLQLGHRLVTLIAAFDRATHGASEA